MRLHIGSLLVLLFAGAASAQVTTYSISGLTFPDGGTVSGTFTFNAATHAYTNVNITTTNGTTRTGATYRFVCGTDVPGCNGLTPSALEVLNLSTNGANQTGLPALALGFASPLGVTTNSVPIAFALEANCSNAACSAPAGASRSALSTGVAIAISTVPTLSEWGLGLVGILLTGLALLQLRQASGNAAA